MPADEGVPGQGGRHQAVGNGEVEGPFGGFAGGQQGGALQDPAACGDAGLFAAGTLPAGQVNPQFAGGEGDAGQHGQDAGYDAAVGDQASVQGQVKADIAVGPGGTRVRRQGFSADVGRVGTGEYDQFLVSVSGRGVRQTGEQVVAVVAAGAGGGQAGGKAPGDAGVLAFDGGRGVGRQGQLGRGAEDASGGQADITGKDAFNIAGGSGSGVYGIGAQGAGHTRREVAGGVDLQGLGGFQAEQAGAGDEIAAGGYGDFGGQGIAGVDGVGGNGDGDAGGGGLATAQQPGDCHGAVRCSRRGNIAGSGWGTPPLCRQERPWGTTAPLPPGLPAGQRRFRGYRGAGRTGCRGDGRRRARRCRRPGAVP